MPGSPLGIVGVYRCFYAEAPHSLGSRRRPSRVSLVVVDEGPFEWDSKRPWNERLLPQGSHHSCLALQMDIEVFEYSWVAPCLVRGQQGFKFWIHLLVASARPNRFAQAFLKPVLWPVVQKKVPYKSMI